MSRIFISYRRIEPDQTVARFLYHHLSDLDHDVFLDTNDIPLGVFWDKEIAENVRRADSFIPLVSSSYLFSPYIIEKELKVAAKLLAEKKIERILQVNLAFDGEPPESVREVLTQIQHFKWLSPSDTPRLCQEIAVQLPSAELLVKGMRPFVTADQKLFSQLGREEDIAAFLPQLSSSAPIVLVHGVSGAGKTSFLKAGVAPRLGDTRWTIVELTENATSSFGGLVAEDCQLIVLDQFEQSLIRFATSDNERQSFEQSVTTWIGKVPERKVIFCLRDEYRTAFDTMLPQLSSRSVNFPLVPLRPEAASRVLELLLDSVGVKYDAEFLPRLCAEYLAENVPKTVLPALLQLLAQYCQNRRTKLEKVTWDRLLSSNSSLFEDHLRESVLERLPRNVSRLEAIESLAALTEAEVKSRRKSVPEIAGETQLKEASVSRTLELAAMPHARVVTVEPDEEENRPTYRLVHDLFAPAVLALRREVNKRRDARRRLAVVSSLAVLLLASIVAGAFAFRQWRIAAHQRNEAVVRHLVAESNALRGGPRRYLMQSLILAAEAHRRKPTWESDVALRAALNLMPLPVAQMAHGSMVVAAKFSPDGQKVVTGGLKDGKSEVRVWEVHSNSPPAVLTVDREVKSVAFNDDGNLIAIGAGTTVGGSGADGGVFVWDLKQNSKVDKAISTPVTEVAFLPGTKQLVAVGSGLARVFSVDGSAPEVLIDFGATNSLTCLSANAARLAVANGLAVKVYSLPDGKALLEKKIEEDKKEKITAMAFNRDGTVFAAAASRIQVLAWNVDTGRLIKEMRGNVRESSALAVSDDGRLLAHAEFSGTIIVRDMRAAEGGRAWLLPDVRTIQSEAPQMRLAFRPNSDHLMAVTDGLTVRYITLRFDADKLNERGMTEVFRAVPEARINSVALSADGRHVVVGDVQGRATVWRWKGGWSVVLGVGLMTFNPSGRFLIGRAYEGVELYDMSNVSRVRTFPSESRGRGSFALSPDGNTVAIRSGEDRDSIDVYDSHTGVKRQQLKVGDSVREFAFSSNSRRLTYKLGNGSLAQTDLGDGAKVSVIMGPSETTSMSLSPRGKYLVNKERKESGNNPITVFEVDSRRKVWEFEAERGSFPDLTFSADERLAAAKIDKQNIVAWETDTGGELWRFPVQEDVWKLALAGDAVMTVRTRTEVIVLDLKNKEVVWRFKPDIGRTRDIDLTPDAQHLMDSSTDDKVRIWNIARRELVTVIDDIEVYGARFSPDGKYIVIEGLKPSSYFDHVDLLLPWRPQDLIDEACARITHNIIQTDWRQFFGGDAYVEAPCGSRPSQLLRS